MQVSVENTSSLGRKLTVVVPKDVVTQQYQERVNKLKGEIQLKGFRAGKVPKEVIEKRFSKAIHAEIVNDLINSSYKDAIAAEQLEPAGQSEIKDVKAEQGEDVVYVAHLEVYPEIVIKPFKDITVEKRVATLKDSDIDEAINKLKRTHAEFKEVSRAAKSTDRLKVNYIRTIDNDQSDKREGVYFDLSSAALFDDIKKGLKGKKAGDEVSLSLTFPEDLQDKSMASKPFTLDVTVVSVEEPTLLSEEELVKKLEGETVISFDEFRNKIKERMTAELDKAIAADLQEKVLEKLVEANTFEVPTALVTQEKKAMLQEARTQMERGQMPSFDLKEMDEMAHRRVVLGLLLNAIIRSEDLTVDGRKVREEIENIAKTFGANSEKIREIYYSNKELLSTVERSVLLSQAVERVTQEAKMSEVQSTFAELTEG